MDHGTDTRCYRNRILRPVLLVAAFSIAGGTALALESGVHVLYGRDYLAEFNAKYLTEGTVLDSCKLCHGSYPLSYARNSFGLDFADAEIGNHTFNEILESADSDGDGFSNLREIYARSLPGSFLSTPPESGPALSFMPEDGEGNVSVNREVTISTDGSADIRFAVDPGTFTLTVADPDAVSAAVQATTCADGGVVLVQDVEYNASGTEARFKPVCDLAYATAYTAEIQRLSGGDPPVPGETTRWTFTTVAQTPDSDGDGVPDGEDDYPNDEKKATPPTARGTGKILVDACGNAGIALTDCPALAEAEGISDIYPQLNRRGKPFGFDFPDGLVRYTLTGLTPGATVEVAVSFPSGVPPGSRVYKVDADGFQEVLDAVVHGNRVLVTLTDGGSGDADGVANGVIVDPIGVAVPAAGAGSIEGSSTAPGSGGCSMAGSGGGPREVLGSFGLIVLAGLVLALMRRKTERGA